VQLRDFAKAGVHPTIGLNGADIALEGQFYPTTRDDSEMTADAFSLLGGVFSASAVNQSSDCPESANGIGDRMTQRQGICQDIY
jgi:hypothetical protein